MNTSFLEELAQRVERVGAAPAYTGARAARVVGELGEGDLGEVVLEEDGAVLFGEGGDGVADDVAQGAILKLCGGLYEGGQLFEALRGQELDVARRRARRVAPPDPALAAAEVDHRVAQARPDDRLVDGDGVGGGGELDEGEAARLDEVFL